MGACPDMLADDCGCACTCVCVCVCVCVAWGVCVCGVGCICWCTQVRDPQLAAPRMAAHRERLVRLGVEAAPFNPARLAREYGKDGNVRFRVWSVRTCEGVGVCGWCGVVWWNGDKVTGAVSCCTHDSFPDMCWRRIGLLVLFRSLACSAWGRDDARPFPNPPNDLQIRCFIRSFSALCGEL